MSESKTLVVTYTTAEAAYDGFGTTTVCVVGRVVSNDKTIRKVQTPDRHAQWQRMRFQSGNHMAIDEAEFQKRVEYGLIEGLEIAS